MSGFEALPVWGALLWRPQKACTPTKSYKIGSNKDHGQADTCPGGGNFTCPFTGNVHGVEAFSFPCPVHKQGIHQEHRIRPSASLRLYRPLPGTSPQLMAIDGCGPLSLSLVCSASTCPLAGRDLSIAAWVVGTWWVSSSE